MTYSYPLSIQDILKILPHGYPFLLIDYVEYLDDKSIIAVKNVTYNENYFIGHFPNNPVMPGVLILEALAQASAILASSILTNNNKKDVPNVLLTSIDNGRFKKIVSPGDVLKLHSSLTHRTGFMWKFSTSAKVGSNLVSQASIGALSK